MEKESGNIKVLYPPRSMGIFFVQYFAGVPLVSALMTTYRTTMSFTNISHGELVILLAVFILPGFLAGFLMLYYSEQYRTRIVLDDDKKILRKIKKGAKSEEFDLNDVKAIVSKTVNNLPGGCKYSLAIEDSLEHSKNIFSEDTSYGARRWRAFAEKLSGITGLPLKQEYYAEQFDGRLLKKTPDEQASNKRHALIMLLTPLLISFIGAVIYKGYGTFRPFILIGCGTVVINVAFSLIYAFLYRDKLEFLGKNNFISVVFILTRSIPYSLFYLFSSHLLTGFRWPLGN